MSEKHSFVYMSDYNSRHELIRAITLDVWRVSVWNAASCVASCLLVVGGGLEEQHVGFCESGE